MTIHFINDLTADTFYSTNDAANGDTFDLTANSVGMSLWNLSDTTIRFLANHDSATLVNTGPGQNIYDMGHGTDLTFAAGDQGTINVYDFQFDKTGHITEMATATTTAHLTPRSDGHGGLYLTGIALTIHLVKDPTIAASQHS